MENTSIWSQTVNIPKRNKLEQDLSAEVAVIGAGMAGVLIAHQLARRGVHTVVLEANRIGSGQTRHTTAKITSQHGMIYDAMIQKFGEERARQYAQANQQAIDEYERLIRESDIDCNFERLPAYLYSSAAAEPMRREAEAACRLGIDAHFVAQAVLPVPVAGAVRFSGQAQFHPLKFLRAVASELEIYEETPALSVDGHRIHTPGGDVRADRIVFATHFPFVNVPGWYFMRMHQERSYVLALQSDWLPQGMYYGVDADGLSFRQADGLLLLGGGGHRTGENSGGGRYELLRQRAEALAPGCREVARWSAQDCITLDGLPYIGLYSQSTPDWYVATGFAKWGMSTSMVAAMLIAGQLCGQTPNWADVFDPGRFSLSAAGKNLATDTAQAFKGLAREFLTVPQTALDALPLGHGGIVDVDGRKAGVYKDELGRCHIVQPRCPHLGCQLEWNPDERSWDCPCHGSRFDVDGALIDGPAQEGLQ
ncbi:MAG: FAD-dependent oxidoreductase [Clostridia bacterium]|nr:FAD-dependent oxidoreductase [Clostridia bacterium]